MNASDDIAFEKTGLRRKMRKMLAEITQAQHEAWSPRIVDWLKSADFWSENVGVIGLFGGVRTEPDLLPILPWLQERGHRAAFFAIEDQGILRPHLVRDETCLSVGSFGVLTPDAAKCPRIDEAELSVVLLPGLAFSLSDGARLGRGKGYSNRLLAGLKPEAQTIGIGFSSQVLASVPREFHDICVKSIVSEDGWRAVPSETT